MVILGSFLIQRIWNSKVDDIISKNEAQLASSVIGIDSVLSSSIDKMLYINNNFYIRNYLETNTDQNLVGIMSFSDYLQSVIGAINADSSKVEVAIYALNDTNYNGNYLRSIQSLENIKDNLGVTLKDEILSYADDTITWKFRMVKDLNTGEDINYIYAYKKIGSFNKTLAITEIRIPFNQILKLFQYEIPQGKLYSLRCGEGKAKNYYKK